MNKLWSLTLGTLALSACGSNGIEGIWVISLNAETSLEAEYDCSENFTDAACPVEGEVVESEWTVTEEYESSPGLIMAEIVGGPRGEAFMFIGDQVVPGLKDGVWNFEFDSFADETITTNHESGYSFSQRDYDSTKVTITFNADLGGHAEGVFRGTNETILSYQESDTWNAWDEGGTGFSGGQLPASSYLEGEGNSNVDDESNCAADSCELEFTEVSTSATGFIASRTELKEGDDFTAIEHDGAQ